MSRHFSASAMVFTTSGMERLDSAFRPFTGLSREAQRLEDVPADPARSRLDFVRAVGVAIDRPIFPI
jgi:hypothetical protein